MFDKIRQGDRIISTLNSEEVTNYMNVHEQFKEFEHYRSKMTRAFNKFQAMQVLFWETMMGKHEMCESASHRGKILSTCKFDDKFVIVERQPTEESEGE